MPSLRILVTGGRDYSDTATVVYWLGAAAAQYGDGKDGVTLVHGGARGADRLAAEIARHSGWRTEAHRAEWEKYGPAAGPYRNEDMVANGADVCVAFPGGRGTEHCTRLAREAGIPVIEVPEPEEA